jgi:ubiquinone/menaquinone biosynthesis C-methylase UbiE
MGDTYTHGHHESVLRSHEWRTADNSAGYLLSSLRPGQRLLDVGCGPGTNTLDLAERVAPGVVLGIDASADVVERARAAADARPRPGVTDVSFEVGDVYALEHPDDAFDVVHAHQVLQHLTEPVAALREMRRVLAPGGTVAVRDSDYGCFTWSPPSDRLTRWSELYHQVTARNRADADAGRHLEGWVREAGFSDVRVSESTWVFDQPDTRAWWGSLWADRVQQSAFATQAVDYGLADEHELAELADTWRGWAADPTSSISIPSTEVLAAP